MKGSFTLRGLDEYFEQLAAAEKDVDQVAADVLEEEAPLAETLMVNNLRKTSEQWTGDTEKTLFVTEVQQDGNYSFIEAGSNTSKDPAAFHKEYGTARQAAEPWLRPTFKKLRSELRKMLKAVAQGVGV